MTSHRILVIWRSLAVAQLREQPGRVLIGVLTIALGVALFSGVYMINTAALNEFDRATRRLVGQADISVRGSRSGFSEQLYAELAQDAEVRVASPILELEVARPERRSPLRIMGLDLFRASAIQPALLGEIAGNTLGLFAADGIVLSVSAARDLRVARGERFTVLIGDQRRSLMVLGILAGENYPERLGIMDIASAQWTLGALGTINRIDLQLRAGTDVDSFRSRIARRLPAGVQAATPEVELARAASITRAYRVNLSMLALVSLLTGAFLVFATQSLSILRRRTSLALLRALGVTRGGLQAALLGEGIALGAIGSLLGVAIGYVLAVLVLAAFRSGFGPGQLAAVAVHVQPLACIAFFLVGTLIASLGAWVPAREAARRAPARALKAGDAEPAVASRRFWRHGLMLLLLGALLAWLPAIGGVPVFGYAAIGALLFGALLLVPVSSAWLLEHAPPSGRVSLDIGLAQLRGSVSQITVSLAAIIVSFSLMVAMAIMVYSFRQSFERWLQQSLPADIQVRATQGSDTKFLTSADQGALASLAGIATVEFRRSTQLSLAADRAPITLIARDYVPSNRADSLPLIEAAEAPAPGAPPVWISEAMQDLYGYRVGSRIELPLAGRAIPLHVAGVFRDYGRSSGAVVIARDIYRQLTGDGAASEAALWLAPRADASAVIGTIRTRLAEGATLEIRSSTEVRELSVRAFDRAFIVTYALEGAAVLIGLIGVALAGASNALARRSEFGMLRHLGMLRRQIVAMLAGEGLLISALGALYGLIVGAALSLVLVYVVNRQSFNWSIDLAVPWWQLLALSGVLLLAATITNMVSGRAALSTEALRAVKEDW